MADSTADIAAGVPRWTSKEEKRGIDPLGMQTTSVELYQELLPGISNVTLRMRYYGLYAWLADSFARNVHDKSVGVWQRYIRRSEALYALVAAHDGGAAGVAGTRWAKRKLEAAEKDEISFDRHTDNPGGNAQYLKQAFGAFGAAYGSQLREIGLLDECEDHDIPIPSEGVGEALADAFRRAIGPIASRFLSAADAGVVTKAQLKQMAPMLPSYIEAESRERQIYEDLLFARIGPQSENARSRRDTLRLVLHISQAFNSYVAASDVRWSLYAQRDGEGETLQESAGGCQEQRLFWALYHANDLLHVAYEALFEYTLGILGTAPAGMELSELVDKVSSRLEQALATYQADSWSSLLTALSPPANAWSDEEPLSEFFLASDLLYRSDPLTVSPDDFGANALKLLAILHRRWGAMVDEIASQRPTTVKESFSRSIVTEVRFLDANATEPLRWLIALLIKARVVERHLWVAVRKLRGQGDYTFLLEADEGKVRVRKKEGPVLTNPRLASAIAFLWDISLMDDNGPTEAGLAAMEAA